jgi:hypothetical protein
MFDINMYNDSIEAGDQRLSKKNNDGTRSVPAHEQIFATLTLKHEGFADCFYLHYMWSNVSCVRVKKGKLKQAFSFLSNGGYVTPFEAERRLRSLVTEACAAYTAQTSSKVSFDTKRSNDGFAGFYTYLGVDNCESFLALGRKRKREGEAVEEARTKAVFSNSPLKEQLLQSLDVIETAVKSLPEEGEL